MADARTLITKRVSLAGLAEGWEDCYAIITPASYQDYDAVAKLDMSTLTKADDIKLQMDTVKAHFVAGKVKVWGSDELIDMKAEDAESSVGLANRLYLEIMGLKLDPKGSGAESVAADTPSVTTPSVEPQPNSEATTETTSSTESLKTYPHKSSETSPSSDTASDSDSPIVTQ